MENSFIRIDEEMENWWKLVAPHLDKSIVFGDSRKQTKVYAYQVS